MPWFRNHYRHCGTEWDDQWDCQCNDECPECKAEIEPFESEEICKECGSTDIKDGVCRSCGSNWEGQSAE